MAMMLDFYEKLATRLYPLRHLVLALGAVSIGAFVATVLFSSGPADEAYMLVALVVLLWCLSLGALVHTFVHPAPVVNPADRWFARTAARIKRGVRWLMAAMMTLLCIAVLVGSLKAFGLIAKNL